VDEKFIFSKMRTKFNEGRMLKLLGGGNKKASSQQESNPKPDNMVQKHITDYIDKKESQE
jgi:hypothetical protein